MPAEPIGRRDRRLCRRDFPPPPVRWLVPKNKFSRPYLYSCLAAIVWMCGICFSEIVPERLPPATCALAGAEKQIPHIHTIAARQEYKYGRENFREDNESPPLLG